MTVSLDIAPPDYAEWSEDQRNAWWERKPDGAGSGPRSRKMRIEWFDEAATAAADDPPDALIAELLDAGALSVIYGDSNSGKTFVALDLAFHVATGTAWNDRTVKRGLVVYVAAEGGTRIRKRLAALKRRHDELYGNGVVAPLFALIRYPIDLRSSDANLKELLTLITEAASETGEPCVWVIVDTLSRAMAGGDENSPVDMGRIVLAADTIRDETGAHFSFVHHTGKDAARGARGHSLLRAATDTELEVVPGAVSATKQRDMECNFSIGFALLDIHIGDDANGLPIKSAIVDWNGDSARPTKAQQGGAVPRGQRLLMSVIREALDEAGQDIRPLHDGPIVRAVSADIVRNRLYVKIAETADPDDDPRKLANRRRQAFGRAIEAEIKAQALLSATHNGDRVLWLP